MLRLAHMKHLILEEKEIKGSLSQLASLTRAPGLRDCCSVNDSKFTDTETISPLPPFNFSFFEINLGPGGRDEYDGPGRYTVFAVSK